MSNQALAGSGLLPADKELSCGMGMDNMDYLL